MKKLLVFCLVTLMALSLFAGGAKESESKTASGKTPITMWFWGTHEGNQAALQEVLVDKFNETHPDYELTIEYRPSVNSDIAVALAAGEGPDIVYESSPSLSLVYIQSGKYADLTEYSEKYGWKDKLIGPMYDSSSVDGHLYSVPMGLNYITMVYNEKVLEENGWSVPTTIDELEAIMDEAMAKGMYASVTGAKGWKATNEDYSTMFFTSFAGPEEMYKCLTGEQKWDSKWMEWAVEKSAEWYQKGYLCSDYLTIDWGEAAQLLVDGKAPFFFGPVKFIQNIGQYVDYDKADFIKMAPIPSGRDGVPVAYSLGATGILAINANSKNKDVCAEFLDMFMSIEFVSEISQVWPGYWGVPLKNLSDVDTSSSSGLGKNYLESLKIACEAIDKGNFGYYCSSYIPPETFDIVCNIDSVWLGEMSASELLSSMDEAFAREQAQNLVPPVPEPGK